MFERVNEIIKVSTASLLYTFVFGFMIDINVHNMQFKILDKI